MRLSLQFFARLLMRVLHLLVLLLGAALLAQAQSTPVIRYVKPTATGNGSGSSWVNASNNLQAMINASSSGQQVWVAAGTYKPTTGTDRAISFYMKNGVSMYGGFTGSETALNSRPAINLTTPSATILSGDIGDVNDPEDNSFSVILNRLGVTNSTVLDGFVITGGNANQSGPVQEPRNLGGGIYNVNQSSSANPSSGSPSSPQISNCLFVANSAASGGAIYNGAGGTGVSNATLTNCVFRNNTASGNGGAIYNRGGSSTAIQPKLTNCLFQSNSADAGGAVYNDGFSGRTSNPDIINCAFQDNSASNGGAVYNYGRSDEGNSSPTLTNCSFKNNKAISKDINATEPLDQGGLGGAILNDGDFNGNSSPLIRNCSFQTNSAVNGGAVYTLTGGIRGDNRSSPKLTNCLFQANTASSGGAIYNFTRYEGEIELVLTNCTFQANTAGIGGVLFGFGYGNGYLSNTTLINCVLFGNGGGNTFYNNSTTISATYSLFDTSVNGYSGTTGNRKVTVSPFASTSDPALFACSPAVNAGLNSATGLVGVTTDLANKPRVYGERVDMGAYEYQAAGGLAITVPGVSTATAGVAFNQSFTASGGTSPYSFSLASGSLPAGLNLAANGTLSGTPTGLGSFSITVRATNATSCTGVSAPYVLTVRAPVSPIRYVRVGGTGSGSSWIDASGNLQSQIDFAGAEQVWVAQGTYKPTTTNDRSISFSMKNGVAIYGGFAGTETTLAQRNPTSLTTVLSGNIGNAGSNTDNTFNVFNHPRELNLNNTAVLDGFVIRDGYENEPNSLGYYGGGMYNDTSSPTITNCSFLDNTSFLGGGMFNNGNSNPVLSNCNFRGNTALNTGGGIHNQGSSKPSLTNCNFVGNRARFGGGMGSDNSSPTLTNCLFQGNTASEIGGGMYNTSVTNTTLTNCSFLNNTAVERGGGIYNDTSSPSLTNCLFQSNTARDGGGICSAQSLPALTNCLFQANSATRHGGGMLNDNNTNAALTNCSFQGNTASGFGAGIYNFSSSPTLTNGVVFGNGGANTFYNERAGTTTVTYSLLETGLRNFTDGGNNLTTTVSPFISATDARLNACSPAINTGNNAVNSTTTDLAGNARRFNDGPGTPGGIDMGAYEYQAAPTVITLTAPGVSTATAGVAFDQSFVASGGTSPYSFSLASGPLPAGLTLASTGVLSGTPTQSGSFTITVLGQDATGCSGVSTPYGLTVNEAVSPAPTLTGLVVSPGVVCLGSVATFTATVGNVTGSYSYTLTNGTSVTSGTGTGTAFSQSVTAGGTGPQNFTLTVMANGQSTASVTALTVSSLPVASLINNGPLNCAQSSVTLTAGGGSSYTFATGSGILGTPGPANTVVVSNAGVYSVTVANASGCVSTTSTSVTADQTIPSVTITPGSSTLSCASPTVSLTAIGNGSVRWSTGETSSTISVSVAGTYSVTLTGDNTCTAVASTSVISTTAAVTITNPTVSTATAGVAFNQSFVASGGTSPYSFSLASGPLPAGLTLASTGVLSGTPTQSGSFTITVLGQDATGCSGVSTPYGLTVNEAVSPAPTLTGLVVSPGVVCLGSVATFTATVGNVAGSYSYTLTNGTSVTSGTGTGAAFSQPLTATGSGVQTFTLTVSREGQSTTATTSLTVNTPPSPTLSSSGRLTCANPSVTLTASGGDMYRFSSGANQIDDGPTATVSAAGVYSVTVISTNGCTATTSTEVAGDQTLPTASLTNTGPLSCSAITVTLTASGGNTYRFSSGANQIGDGSTATVSTAGVYSVTVISTNSCSSVASTTVTGDVSVPSVQIQAAPSLTIAQGQTTRLTASASGSQPLAYTWSTGQDTPAISVSTAGTYSLTVTGSNACSATASVVVSVTATPVVSGPFSITGVNLVSCTPINESRNVISINPEYDGLDGSPVSFSVVNEFRPTTDPGPYTLQLYVDNPVITLRAVQSGVVTSFTYNWLAACNRGGTPVVNTPPTVVRGIASQTATAGGYFSLNLAGTFTDAQTPDALVLSASGLPADLRLSGTTLSGLLSTSGVSTITLTATDPGGLSANTGFTLTVQPAPEGNTAPTVVGPLASQTALVGQFFTLSAASVFTDAETPNALVLSSNGLPAGLTLTGTTIAGTPTVSGSSTVVLTATDPGNLSTGTSFVLTVQAAPTTGETFALVGVTTLSCTPIVAGRIDISFTPRYAGLNGSGVTFSVPNELAPTTAGGPYSLQLYTDNPTITLQAVQSGVVSRYAYNWLAACSSGANPTPVNTAPRMARTVGPQSATIGQGYSLPLATAFTDTETPDKLVLSASGLPAGLSLTGTTISGTPGVSGTSTVVLTATDPGSLTASTSFVLTVSPASSVPTTTPFAITSVTPVSCTVISAGQRRVNFMPQYAGLTGQPVRFSVVNELSATTQAGPYTLNLYTDNPIITLSAEQGNVTTTYAYAWLAGCPSGARTSAPEAGSGLQVQVLGNPVAGSEVVVAVRGAQGQPLRLLLTDVTGRPVSEQRVEQAGGVETVRLPVGAQAGGVLLLQVSTPTQRQTVKVLTR